MFMIDLNAIATKAPENENKKACKKKLKALRKQLFDWQNMFYADKRFGLLVILQGMDASGKDGVTRHVFTCMNPMGIDVKSFKKPTEEEQTHDFLWRVYPHFPAKGYIQIFNRSYYEDITVPEVHDYITEEKIAHRIQLINAVEKHLEQSNVHVIKFFLHISKNEQIERINDRLMKPHKRWKYSPEDKIATQNWDKYTDIYNRVLSENTTIPWHIIPSDSKWYRNYSVAKIIEQHLKNLNLRFPDPKY